MFSFLFWGDPVNLFRMFFELIFCNACLDQWTIKIKTKIAHHNFAELTVRSAVWQKSKINFPFQKRQWVLVLCLLTDRFQAQFSVIFMENSNPPHKNVQCTQCTQLLIRPLQNSWPKDELILNNDSLFQLSISLVNWMHWALKSVSQCAFSFVYWINKAIVRNFMFPCVWFQMGSQYQRSVPLEVRRAEGERVRAKHPDKIPVSTTTVTFSSKLD